MATSCWFFLLLLVPLIAKFLLKKKKNSSKNLDLPGPPGLPFLGNLHQLDSEKPQEYLMKLSNEYGPVFKLKLGHLPVLVISSADAAREALKRNDIAFSGRPSLFASERLSYGRLDVGFSTYGEYWREMRKMTVLHLLSVKKVQSFRPVHEDEILELVKQISILSSSSQPINIKSSIVALTSRIICRIAFGKTGDIAATEGRRSANQILTETEAMLGGFFVSDYIPFLGWIDKLTGMSSRLEKNFQELDSFYHELIQEHLNPNRPQSAKNNILDMLIELKEEQASTVDLTWDHIKAILTNIFIAGTDSTAATAIWAMTYLMKNPSTLKRLQAEIRDFCAKQTKLDADELRELPYLGAVIKETLRMNMPVPLLLPRETVDHCEVAGYDIKPNTFVFINAWAIARDPKIWESPDEFKPERFLNSDVDVIKGQHFELIPFGSGRRGCPGANLALATVDLILTNLLNYFDWELPPGMTEEDIDTQGLPGLTMLPKNPICLVPKKRAFS